jgi:hypothetical protein
MFFTAVPDSALTAPPRQTGQTRRIRRRWSGFSQDTGGDVALFLGLMLATSLMIIGAAVDMARWLHAREQTIQAIDAAVLAGGRYLQTNSADEAGAIAAALQYYEQSVVGRALLSSDDVNFAVADSGTAVVASGNAKIRTPFMGFAGVPELPLLRLSGSGGQKAVIASGGNAGMNLEVALMLDTSATMSQSAASGSTKIADLKLAASDLINILVWDNQSTFKSRVALVPFSGDVRMPSAWVAQVQDPASRPTLAVTINAARRSYLRTVCVTERVGADRYTAAAPGPGKYLPPAYTANGRCAQSSVNDEVVAMTSDKTLLLDKVSKLALGGGTAGHIGTAWTYYMLSPDWAPVLPAVSAPAAFNTSTTQKIAVLMTDGEFTVTHDAQGVATTDTGGNGNSASSADQAIAICGQMKSSGIQIYTIGFQLQGNATAIATLNSCASDATKFYDATDGTKLKSAFRDIALKVSPLHLVN